MFNSEEPEKLSQSEELSPHIAERMGEFSKTLAIISSIEEQEEQTKRTYLVQEDTETPTRPNESPSADIAEISRRIEEIYSEEKEAA